MQTKHPNNLLITKSRQIMWRNVLCSEETKVKTFQQNFKLYICHKNKTSIHFKGNTIPKVKHDGGGSTILLLFIWNWFQVKKDRIMDFFKHQSMSEKDLTWYNLQLLQVTEKSLELKMCKFLTVALHCSTPTGTQHPVCV